MLCHAAQNTLEPSSYALDGITTDRYARTAIVAHNGNWDIAMSQFNAESAEHVRDDLYFRKRRDKLCGYTRTRTKKQVVQDWQAPIRQLLICHTIGRLIREGDSACKPDLKAGSGIVAALLGSRVSAS